MLCVWEVFIFNLTFECMKRRDKIRKQDKNHWAFRQTN